MWRLPFFFFFFFSPLFYPETRQAQFEKKAAVINRRNYLFPLFFFPFFFLREVFIIFGADVEGSRFLFSPPPFFFFL